MMKSEKSMSSSGLSLKDRMFDGDIPLILDNLNSNNNLGIVLAIGALIKNNIRTDETDIALKKHINNHSFEFCMNVSELAYAALDILGIEPYIGDNINVLNIIDDKLSFMS